MTKTADLRAIDDLRAAELIVKNYADAIQIEMLERANQGILWQSGMCKSWPDYADAVAKQNLLRAKYGV